MTKSQNDIIVKIKTLDNNVREFNLEDFKEYTVEDIKNYYFSDEMEDETKIVKFIFSGQILNSNEQLCNINFSDNNFIHCIVATLEDDPE